MGTARSSLFNCGAVAASHSHSRWYPTLLLESSPTHESAEGREGIVGGTEPDVAAIGRERENRFTAGCSVQEGAEFMPTT